MNYKEQKKSMLLTRILMLSIISAVHSGPSFAEEAAQQTNAESTPASSVTDQPGSEKSATVAADPEGTQTVSQTTDADLSSADSSLPPLNEPQKDPYEGFNRAMFTFNDKLDQYILKPVATVYNKITPKPLNQGIHNFFNNLGTLPTIANDILQLHFYQAANDIWRFGINTTVGVAGFFDVATRMNLKYYSNDFGLTLARWGYKNSNYLVLPFFGPSSLRDGIGIPVDYFVFSVYPYVDPQSVRWGLYGVGVVDRRAQLLKVESVMEEAALDKYVFIRDAYMQRRTYQIEQNQHLGYQEQQAEAKLQTEEKALPATNKELTPEAI